jgi:hypothetical protein
LDFLDDCQQGPLEFLLLWRLVQVSCSLFCLAVYVLNRFGGVFLHMMDKNLLSECILKINPSTLSFAFFPLNVIF